MLISLKSAVLKIGWSYIFFRDTINHEIVISDFYRFFPIILWSSHTDLTVSAEYFFSKFCSLPQVHKSIQIMEKLCEERYFFSLGEIIRTITASFREALRNNWIIRRICVSREVFRSNGYFQISIEWSINFHTDCRKPLDQKIFVYVVAQDCQFWVILSKLVGSVTWRTTVLHDKYY